MKRIIHWISGVSQCRHRRKLNKLALCDLIADEHTISPGGLSSHPNIECSPSELGSPMRHRMKTLVMNETPPQEPNEAVDTPEALNELRSIPSPDLIRLLLHQLDPAMMILPPRKSMLRISHHLKNREQMMS
jgi:hypothetical protein